MFFPGSRYEKVGTVTITRADGTRVAVTKLPLPLQNPLRGFHRRLDGQRLDLIASHYFNDATAFWQLCDANNTMVAGALAAHELIGIPVQES
jgi:hypothetical protein